MSNDTLLIASPLFFVHPVRGGVRAIDVTRNERYRALGPQVFELLAFFLEPAAIGSAVNAGFGPEIIEEAIKAGILMPHETPLAEDSLRWENHRWSRSAYLTFSQLDLDYVEPTEDFEELEGLSDFRRKAIRNYLREQPYPDILLNECDSPIELPLGELSATPDLDSMLSRRSVRFFSNEPVGLDIFGGLLFEAAKNVRLAEESKQGGDPYFLLNSFYSWLNIFIAVQGVEGVPRGVYQYDPLKHRLHLIVEGLDDRQVIECIQYQKWINGAGFCLFVVVQWDRYMWIYRHSRAYLNLLIQLGEFGQEVLHAMGRRGLGAWMTPAITESKAAALLCLDPLRQDAMYFMKVGPPPQ